VIAIVVRDGEIKSRVRDLLKTYGAYAITYFGLLATEVLEI